MVNGVYPFAACVMSARQKDRWFANIKIHGIHPGGLLPFEHYPLVYVPFEILTEQDRKTNLAHTQFAGFYHPIKDRYYIVAKLHDENLIALKHVVPIVERIMNMGIESLYSILDEEQ